MLVWQDFPCISDKQNMEEADTEDRKVFRQETFTCTLISESIDSSENSYNFDIQRLFVNKPT